MQTGPMLISDICFEHGILQDEHATCMGEIYQLEQRLHEFTQILHLMSLEDTFGTKQLPAIVTPSTLAQYEAIKLALVGVRCEGFLAESLTSGTKYVFQELFLIVKSIIQKIVDFFRGLFRRQIKSRNSAKWYLEHFRKYQINNGRFRHHVAPLVTNDVLVSRITALYQLSFQINPLLNLFESAGELSWGHLKSTGTIDKLISAGFKLEPEGEGIRVNGLEQPDTTPDQAVQVGQAGWNKLSVPEGLRHVVQLSDAFEQLNDLHKTLKKTLLDRMKVQVVDESTSRRYNQGVVAIDKILMLYGASVAKVADSMVAIAEIARRFCD